MQKTCGKCKKDKDLGTDFYERGDAPGKYRSICKDCMALNARKYDRALTDDEKLAASLRRYNMTPEQYQKMFAEQGGVCAICKQPETRGCRGREIKRLSVDHDHRCCPGQQSCGQCIRSLLCDRCNRVVGLASEDSWLLRQMADYVDLHSDNTSGI